MYLEKYKFYLYNKTSLSIYVCVYDTFNLPNNLLINATKHFNLIN